MIENKIDENVKNSSYCDNCVWMLTFDSKNSPNLLFNWSVYWGNENILRFHLSQTNQTNQFMIGNSEALKIAPTNLTEAIDGNDNKWKVLISDSKRHEWVSLWLQEEFIYILHVLNFTRRILSFRLFFEMKRRIRPISQCLWPRMVSRHPFSDDQWFKCAFKAV